MSLESPTNDSRGGVSSGEFTNFFGPYGDAGGTSSSPLTPVLSAEESWIMNTTTTSSYSNGSSSHHRTRSPRRSKYTGNAGFRSPASYSARSGDTTTATSASNISVDTGGSSRSKVTTTTTLVPWPASDTRSYYHDDDDGTATDEETFLSTMVTEEKKQPEGFIYKDDKEEPSCITDYYRKPTDATYVHRRKFPIRDETNVGSKVVRTVTPNASPRCAHHVDVGNNERDRVIVPSADDRLAMVERNLQLVEDQVALHHRLMHLEDCMARRDVEMKTLQDEVWEMKTYDSHSVSWKIPAFEKRLVPGKRHFFESTTFGTRSCPFYLTVCVLEVDDTVPEAKRPVAIFIKSALPRERSHSNNKSRSNNNGKRSHQDPVKDNIFPLRLDGSSLTLVGRSDRYDKICR